MANPEKQVSVNVGKVAIQRDGHVGLIMDVDGKNYVVDGETVASVDVRVIYAGDKDGTISKLAAELGHDEEAQTALVECVKGLWEKLDKQNDSTPPPSNVISMTKQFVPPSAAQSDSTPPTEVQEIAAIDTLAEEAAIEVRPQAIIDSLRAEIKLLEKQIDASTSNPDLATVVEDLSKKLELESAMRQKADKALVEAEALITETLAAAEKAKEAAASEHLEVMRLKKEASPIPVAKRSGAKPIEARLISRTGEAEFERLWTEDWELIHADFAPNGDVRSLWRKVNVYSRPDGSPLHESLALPSFDTPMDDEDTWSAARSDARLGSFVPQGAMIGSMNTIEAGPQARLRKPELISNEWILDSSSAARSDARLVEAEIDDALPRFKGLLEGMPISQALLTHGLEKTKQAMDAAAVMAMQTTMEEINAVAARPIHQFGQLLEAGV